MASAYATLENDGVYRTPTCIEKITDAQGNVIVENSSTSKVVYEQNASRMMTDVLKSVLTEGTGTAYRISNAICAGKTGTTNDTNDSWFVGYSTYYTTAVWVGYDYPQSLDPDYGRISSGMIWKAFMEQYIPVLKYRISRRILNRLLKRKRKKKQPMKLSMKKRKKVKQTETLFMKKIPGCFFRPGIFYVSGKLISTLNTYFIKFSKDVFYFKHPFLFLFINHDSPDASSKGDSILNRIS